MYLRILGFKYPEAVLELHEELGCFESRVQTNVSIDDLNKTINAKSATHGEKRNRHC
jgi:hypothetical protein